MTRMPIANLKRDMTVRTKEIKPNNSPSPVSYPEKDKHWKKLSHQPLAPSFSVPKVKASRFLDKHIANKKWVPGVGTHRESDIKHFLNLSHGSMPRYKSGR